MLEAGRELDARVAEKVMGWDLTLAIAKTLDGEGWTSPPCYSTDIAAAWEVVEKWVTDEYRSVELVHGVDGANLCRFRERGYRPFQDMEWVEQAPTAPLAICLAALKAVGYEPKESA